MSFSVKAGILMLSVITGSMLAKATSEASAEGVFRNYEDEIGGDVQNVPLTREERDLLDWAKQQKMHERHVQSLGWETTNREDFWLGKGRKLLGVLQAKLTEANPQRVTLSWDIQPAELKAAWAHLAKVMQADMPDQAYRPLVGKHVDGKFVVTGTCFDVSRFATAVVCLREPNVRHTEYSVTDELVRIDRNLRDQQSAKVRQPGYNYLGINETFTVTYQITDVLRRQEWIFALNEAIELWPGDFNVEGTGPIKPKAKKE